MPKGSLENHLFRSELCIPVILLGIMLVLCFTYVYTYWILMLIHNNETSGLLSVGVLRGK